MHVDEKIFKRITQRLSLLEERDEINCETISNLIRAFKVLSARQSRSSGSSDPFDMVMVGPHNKPCVLPPGLEEELNSPIHKWAVDHLTEADKAEYFRRTRLIWDLRQMKIDRETRVRGSISCGVKTSPGGSGGGNSNSLIIVSYKEHREWQERMDREAKEAWAIWKKSLTKKEKATLVKSGIYGHDSDLQRGSIRRIRDHDEVSLIAATENDYYFDDPPEMSDERITFAAEAILKTLYILTGSNHPSLRLQSDCLLAIINRQEEKSQAAIARKYNLTRAAVSKRIRNLRNGDFGELGIYLLCGRADVNKSAPTHRQPPSKICTLIARFWVVIKRNPPESWRSHERQVFLSDLAERESIRRKHGWQLPTINLFTHD